MGNRIIIDEICQQLRCIYRIALWKTIDEFYALFPEVQRYENLECNIFEEKVIEALKEDGFIQNAEDTLVCNVTFSKPIDLSRLNVLINNETELSQVNIYQLACL